MKNFGVIVADIVGSTSIPTTERTKIIRDIRTLLNKLGKESVKSRFVKGDQLELVLDNPEDTLRVAILLKAFVKAKYQSKHDENASRRLFYFGKFALRMAIAVDTMEKIDIRSGIWEGEAIYAAGRAISMDHTYDKQKIVIKSTMDFVSRNKDLQNQFDVIVKLVDELVSRATPRQCEILMLRLFDKTEDQIRRSLKISQSAVNQALNAAGWRSIINAVSYFEATIK